MAALIVTKQVDWRANLPSLPGKTKGMDRPVPQFWNDFNHAKDASPISAVGLAEVLTGTVTWRDASAYFGYFSISLMRSS